MRHKQMGYELWLWPTLVASSPGSAMGWLLKLSRFGFLIYRKEDDGSVPKSLAWGKDWCRASFLDAWLGREHSLLGARVITGRHISGYTWHLVSSLLLVVVAPLKSQDSHGALMLWHAGHRGSVWPGTRVQGKTDSALLTPFSYPKPRPLPLLCASSFTQMIDWHRKDLCNWT